MGTLASPATRNSNDYPIARILLLRSESARRYLLWHDISWREHSPVKGYCKWARLLLLRLVTATIILSLAFYCSDLNRHDDTSFGTTFPGGSIVPSKVIVNGHACFSCDS